MALSDTEAKDMAEEHNKCVHSVTDLFSFFLPFISNYSHILFGKRNKHVSGYYSNKENNMSQT